MNVGKFEVRVVALEFLEGDDFERVVVTGLIDSTDVSRTVNVVFIVVVKLMEDFGFTATALGVEDGLTNIIAARETLRLGLVD